MLRAKRPVMASILASTLILTSTAPALGLAQGSVEDRPGEIAMIGDTIVARPLLLASTIIGFGLFVVSLPASALGGNVGEAADKLIVAPGKATFFRCLGCTLTQNDSLRAKRNTEKALREQEKQTEEQTGQ